MLAPEATNPRKQKLTRKAAMWTERSSWDSHWKEIARHQLPRAGRFFVSDGNRGDKRHNLIYDNTAIFAHRTLAAGMMSGMTSPARPWFRLGLADKDLMEHGPVKEWLHKVTQLMQAIFSSSNTYNALHACYEELGAFGTWANFVAPDFDNVIHHYPMTIGEYALACNSKGYVDTMAREFQLSVGQMVEQFGRDNCSTSVQNLYNRGSMDAWVPVVHMVCPRPKRDRTKRDNLNMPFESVYFEPGSESWDKYLSESGFERFPALCPRWVVTGNDIYGRSPGMDVLGDVKQLQHEQLRKAQAIDHQVNPPLQVPTQYKEAEHARLPGGVMYVDMTGPGNGIRSAFEVNLDMQHLLADIVDVRERIRTGYYADLFLMLANDTRSGTTATEIAERHEEKLLMLGPVLERLHNELLSPLIDITFDRCSAAGILPPPPPEIAGTEINIEFVSMLAQAQRAVAASGADRILTVVGSIAAAKGDTSAWDKIDTDQMTDDYGEMYGVNPKIIVPDEVVAQIRAARAAQQQAMTAAAAAQPMVESAKTASEIDPQGLQDVMGMFSGYTSPSPEYVE